MLYYRRAIACGVTGIELVVAKGINLLFLHLAHVGYIHAKVAVYTVTNTARVGCVGAWQCKAMVYPAHTGVYG